MSARSVVLFLVVCASLCAAQCPPPTKSCGQACYLDDLYCCPNGVLTQKQFCPSDNTCTYGNEQNWKGWGFFDQFNFFNGQDPTHGFVQYVDKATAQSGGLINVTSSGQIYIGVDNQNQASSAGRKSVRIESKNQIKNSLMILDLAHMPGSICGSWPAFWTYGPNWPTSGEIDIIEGVNQETRNSVTLHTKTGCTMSGARDMSGSVKSANCDANINGNAGCGVLLAKNNSYGDSFNTQGGGVYAMERTDSFIKVWYFSRSSVPADTLSGSPNPCGWGQPDAVFPLGGTCTSDFFGPQNIIFNIAFCGDWAGAVFNQGCSGTCTDFVANNPQAFKESYWMINSLRILTR